MQERWLSVQGIAAHLGVNRDTVCKLTERKRMPTQTVGRLRRFPAAEMDAWVKKGTAKERSTEEPHVQGYAN